MTCVADVLTFSNLCRLLDYVANPKLERKLKLHQLKQFMSDWRENHEKLHKDDTATDDSFFPAMRIILPSFDKLRGTYGFKETNLGRKLVNIFLLGKTTNDAKTLLNFKGTSKDSDFAAAASEILKMRLSANKGELTINELNEHLDNVATCNANRDQASLDKELEFLCRRANASELKWLIRILLKQMNLRMGEATVLNLFHPQAGQYYDVSTCLRTVCQKCHDPNKTMDEIEIELFAPFRPMLAARVSPEKCVDLMENKPFYVEIKYDGERVQLHKKGDQYMYFSRNGNDWTNSYGGSRFQGTITPKLDELFDASVKECILDVEMVGWNTEAKCIATKGENFDVKLLKVGDIIEPCIVVFDCLQLNSKVLTAWPLEERLESLKTIFTKEKEGTLYYAKHDIRNTVNELISSLNNAVENREEGVVVKRPTSTYRLNTRDEKAGWIKIKPDYVDQMCDDCDLVIVGGYMGEGIRGNMMSHFLLAAAIKNEDGSPPTKFVSICKVGSGYSMKELYDLNVHLTRNQLIRGSCPDWLKIGGEKAQFYIKPENSKVLQIRAAEISRSSSFATGYTLRFPRVEKIRNDKSWADCMTVDEFEKMRMENDGKIALKLKHKSESAGEEGSPEKKKRIGGGGARNVRPTLGKQFQGADLSNIKAKSKILHGKEICVINGIDNEFEKKKIEIEAAKRGATLTQNPSSKTWCVLAGKKILKVQNLIKVGKYDVVKAEWFKNCVEQEQFIPWKPSDMLFATEATETGFLVNFDKFGDSFTEETDRNSLKQLLEQIKVEGIRSEELTEMEFEINPDYKYGLFKRCRIYLDLYSKFGDAKSRCNKESPLAFTKCQLAIFGANFVDNLEESTHIVIDENDLTRLSDAKSFNRNLLIKVHIVNQNWVEECVDCWRILDERSYAI